MGFFLRRVEETIAELAAIDWGAMLFKDIYRRDTAKPVVVANPTLYGRRPNRAQRRSRKAERVAKGTAAWRDRNWQRYGV